MDPLNKKLIFYSDYEGSTNTEISTENNLIILNDFYGIIYNVNYQLGISEYFVYSVNGRLLSSGIKYIKGGSGLTLNNWKIIVGSDSEILSFIGSINNFTFYPNEYLRRNIEILERRCKKVYYNPCSPGCKTCFGPGQNQCFSCINSKKFLMFHCLDQCPQKYYYNILFKKCMNCYYTCLSCVNSYQCLTCPNTRSFLDLVDRKCKSCYYSCLNCNGKQSNQCANCIENYLLYKGEKII